MLCLLFLNKVGTKYFANFVESKFLLIFFYFCGLRIYGLYLAPNKAKKCEIGIWEFGIDYLIL